MCYIFAQEKGSNCFHLLYHLFLSSQASVCKNDTHELALHVLATGCYPMTKFACRSLAVGLWFEEILPNLPITNIIRRAMPTRQKKGSVLMAHRPSRDFLLIIFENCGELISTVQTRFHSRRLCTGLHCHLRLIGFIILLAISILMLSFSLCFNFYWTIPNFISSFSLLCTRLSYVCKQMLSSLGNFIRRYGCWTQPSCFLLSLNCSTLCTDGLASSGFLLLDGWIATVGRMGSWWIWGEGVKMGKVDDGRIKRKPYRPQTTAREET